MQASYKRFSGPIGTVSLDRGRADAWQITTCGHGVLQTSPHGRALDFREIAARLGPIDLALLPVGAYEPLWVMKDIHMNSAEAVQAHLDRAARQSSAMHFATFQLTPEGIDEPARTGKGAARARCAGGAVPDGGGGRVGDVVALKAVA